MKRGQRRGPPWRDGGQSVWDECDPTRLRKVFGTHLRTSANSGYIRFLAEAHPGKRDGSDSQSCSTKRATKQKAK